MIALRDVIRDGWRDHAAEPLEVAERLAAHVHLVDSAEDAQAFTALAAHAAGAHAGEWARAVALCDAALARVPPEAPELSGLPKPAGLALAAALGTFASMQYVSGEVSAALTTEMRAAAMTPDTALGAIVRIRLLIADALGQQRRTEESRAVYESALTLAEGGAMGELGERAVALTSNNIAGALLDFSSRSAADDATMLRAAHAARKFWQRIGTWENDERSSYLLALVLNALGQYTAARDAATDGLAVIAAHGPEVVDTAFLTLQLAAAQHGLGDEAGYARHLAAATTLAVTFTDDASLTEWFARELRKVSG